MTTCAAKFDAWVRGAAGRVRGRGRVMMRPYTYGELVCLLWGWPAAEYDSFATGQKTLRDGWFRLTVMHQCLHVRTRG